VKCWRTDDGRKVMTIAHMVKARWAKNEKFNMAWRLRGFIIYWLSKFRRLKGFRFYTIMIIQIYYTSAFLFCAKFWTTDRITTFAYLIIILIDDCCRVNRFRTVTVWKTCSLFVKYNVLLWIEFLIITRSLSANGVTSFLGLFLHDLLSLYSRYETESIEHGHVRWLKFSD
jgi:hypothetical protein